MPKLPPDHPEQQPYPSGEAIAGAKQWAHDEDPRMGCWFCGHPSVALAPRHSGGDEDVPAHWLPVCEQHLEHWHDEVDAGEALPIVPRFGVSLNREQATAARHALIDPYGDLRFVPAGTGAMELTREAADALETGLRALNHRLESEDDND